MTTIVKVMGREILDSRGNPTVEADVIWPMAVWGALQYLRARQLASMKPWSCVIAISRYLGKGTLKAVGHINGIAAALRGKDASNQEEIDLGMIELDGTGNKGRLGAAFGH